MPSCRLKRAPAHRHQQFRRHPGGINNGEPIVLRIAFKPTATIRKERQTVDAEGEATTLAGKDGTTMRVAAGRADGGGDGVPVLADHLLRQQGQCSLW